MYIFLLLCFCFFQENFWSRGKCMWKHSTLNYCQSVHFKNQILWMIFYFIELKTHHVECSTGKLLIYARIYAMMKEEIIPKRKSVHFDTRTLCLHTMQLYWRQIIFRCISSPRKFYALVVILKADENTIQYHNNNSSGHLELSSN